MTHLKIFLCFLVFSVAPTSFAEVIRKGWSWAGHYHEEGSSLDVILTENHRMSATIFNWTFPDPVTTMTGQSYKTKGYFPFNGCKVPVETEMVYDPSEKILHLEFRMPGTVWSGICFYTDYETTHHDLALAEGGTGGVDWKQEFGIAGCGTQGAYASAKKPAAYYSQICRNQGGTPIPPAALTELFCSPADPNNISCSMGHCQGTSWITCHFSGVQ